MRRLAGGLVAALLCMRVAVVAVFAGADHRANGAARGAVRRGLAEIPADLLAIYPGGGRNLPPAPVEHPCGGRMGG